MNWKLLALALMLAAYLLELWLCLLRARSARNPIPANVADVYDAETYGKWRAYHAEKNQLSIASSTAAFVVRAALLAFNVYAAFAGLFPKTPFLQLLAVTLLIALSELLSLPFTYRDTMVIEQKYGFNRSDHKTFWSDQVKEFIISLLLTTLISSLLMVTHRALGDWLIVAFAALMTLLALAIAFLYPILSGVFNKFTPLEDGELKQRLTGLLEKHGYRVRAIQVMDASRRSSKSNAYFTGFGRMKTIVLYDTLLQTMTTDEICAVFAHEMGHGLHRDTLKRQLLSFVQMLALGLLAWLTLRSPQVFQAFGFAEVNYGFAAVLIMDVEFAVFAPLFGLISSAVSRRAEYRADAQAVAEGYGKTLVSGLKKLARENYADLSPDPLLVRLTYSHPTLSQRITAIEKASA